MGSNHINGANSTNFDTIEVEKENILPLKEGRSAHRLSSILQEDSFELNRTRASYEQKLKEIDDLDDPLELFLEYIAWLNDVVPQGGSSKRSGMLDIMERCLMYFRDMETYKNDPRLLKLWLWYIELFSPSTDKESKNIFVYMLRKGIGCKLSLFYEEFSALLFEMRKYTEAFNVMKLGIDQNARPLNRLVKRLEEAEIKHREMNIDLQDGTPTALQIFDSELPAFLLGRERASILSHTREMCIAGNDAGQTDNENGQASKCEVFNDQNFNDQIDELRKDGWDILDSRHSRDKENKALLARLEANSNLGKLEQEPTEGQTNNKRLGSNKLPIFKDSSGRTDPVYQIIKVDEKKPEKIDCNFNLIYPNTNEEYCIEEILALSRNIYHPRTNRRTIDKANENSVSHNDVSKKKRKTKALSEKVSQGLFNNSEESPITESKTKTSTLPLNDVLQTKDRDKTEGEKNLQPPNSPTITYFSKDAMNEVYSMFNQNYKEPNVLNETDDTKNKFNLFENFTQDFTRPNIDDLTEVKTAQETNEDFDGELHFQKPINDNNLQKLNPFARQDDSRLKEQIKPSGTLDAIQENTENNVLPREYNENKEESTPNTSTSSSPFMTQPQQIQSTYLSLVIDNPLDDRLRQQLLETIDPPLDRYDTFYRYNQPLKMCALLQKIHRASKSKNKNPIVDFKKTGDLYCIRAELGEGGYATVYLAESSTGNLKALKVEKPASIWEYYILKQIEKRLRGRGVLESIINASSLHCFQDESYLVLNYANQGTILDLINLQREKTNGSVDELLCMFITVELTKVIEAIHEIGVIHGDLKPDNCMIRFERGTLGPFNAQGSYGWSRKGVYLIDFGRSFDMTLLRAGSKFRADWKTDQQDCYEMRHGLPWSYEADYYGLAGIIHSMLFGQFIETVKGINGKLKLQKPLRRYWKHEIWDSLFSVLLNSGEFKELPISSTISKERKKIEMYLTNNAGDKLRDIVLDWESDLVRLNK